MFSSIKRCVFCALGLLMMIALMLGAALLSAGGWLRLVESPRQADAIIVLAGSYERSMHAADLYRENFAPNVYISVPAPDAGNRQIEALGIVLPKELEIHRQILLKKGVPAGNILTFGRGSLSTAEEAEALKKLFTRTGQQLLVVTSPYHVRRAKFILERAFDGTGIGITVVATPYEEYRDDWWRSQDSARKTVLELAKIVYYHAGGRFRSATTLDSSRDVADTPEHEHK